MNIFGVVLDYCVNASLRERLQCCNDCELATYVNNVTEQMFAGDVPEMTQEEALAHIGVKNYRANKYHPHVYKGIYNDCPVFVKILSDRLADRDVGCEFMISQLLSNKSVHFPELVKHHLFKNSADWEHKFNVMMVFSVYRSCPPKKSKDVIKFSTQLCTAIEDMHLLHLVHSDVAPQNIVWDLNGDLVVRITVF